MDDGYTVEMDDKMNGWIQCRTDIFFLCLYSI